MSRRLGLGVLAAAAVLCTAAPSQAQYVIIPGTGRKVAGDNFEAKQWTYKLNRPKSSANLDHQARYPLGRSANGLWYESAKRGQPDVVKRVDTPKGGLPGSKKSLLIQTRDSGVPRYTSRTAQQDDLLFDTRYGSVSLSRSPNVTVRVFLPPFEKWEDNTGSSFGFRAGVMATTFSFKTKPGGLFRKKRRRRVAEREMHYPGMFLQFNSKTDGYPDDSAYFIIRADDYGRDFRGPKITQTGWWTLGMSFTPDGRVHYFARPGVEKLRMKDRIASSRYGSARLETFETFFFDVLSSNNGKSWSTPWVIDDPALHIGRLQATANRGVPRR